MFYVVLNLHLYVLLMIFSTLNFHISCLWKGQFLLWKYLSWWSSESLWLKKVSPRCILQGKAVCFREYRKEPSWRYSLFCL